MRAVFFDRDGTLMEDAPYCGDPARVRVFPGVSAALRSLKDAGFALFVITNQSGIARGLITEDQYQTVHREFLRQVGPGLIDATYYCPDAPGSPSARRKPAPGMVLDAAARYDVDLAQSYLIGDKAADIACGRRAGTRTILVLTGNGARQHCQPDFICSDVVEAAARIIGP